MPNEPYYSNHMETENEYTIHYSLDPFNKRVRIDDYKGQFDYIFKRACEIAVEHSLTKLFIKSHKEDWESFLSRGCMLEGVYRGYFNGQDAYCMAYYWDLERRTSDYWIEEDRILQKVLELPIKSDFPHLAEPLTLRKATTADAKSLADLYHQTFRTYPIPMHDPQYVEKAMKDGTLFYMVELEGELISAASAEIDLRNKNAEMTDCATLPEHRSKGLMRVLIHALENELTAQGIHCFYSLSRALSFGMNAVFHQMGYVYTGRLTKNCNIYDKFEDMNLWVKS